MMGFPDGSPLAGAVRADAMAAKPEINAAVAKCMLAKQKWIEVITRGYGKK
jgi:hypothetical protein